MSEVIEEIGLRRFIIQEREYEYMTGDGVQLFGPFRTVASYQFQHDALNAARRNFTPKEAQDD